MWGSITKLFSTPSKALKTIGTIAGAVGAIAPVVAQFTAPELPKVKAGKTEEELELEAGKAATEKRRELARRKGASSTYRTTKLGVPSDVLTRKTGIGGM